MPRVYLNRAEVAAISESLRWSVYHVENSRYQDAGKASRVAEAKAIQQSFSTKVRREA